MELLILLLVIVLFELAACFAAADSRPADADRATPWYPAYPRD